MSRVEEFKECITQPNISRNQVVQFAIKEYEALAQEMEKGEVWKETAGQYLDNQRYYSGLLDVIAGYFGEAAFISDDGSIQDSPIRAKIPDLVAKLVEERDALAVRLREWEEVIKPEESEAGDKGTGAKEIDNG